MNQRRQFLKLGSLAGLGLTGGGLMSFEAFEEHTLSGKPSRFNMSGYAAPRIERVKIGFIGLGMRGPGAVERMSKIEGVEISALCDLIPERTLAVQESLKQGPQKPKLYSGSEDAWKAMVDELDLDLVYIATPWALHTPMAVYAMEKGKHVAVEVPAARTIEECWQLVETSEKTKRHCMMLENCCYDFFELLTLNMARQGYFGEIIHAEGAYIHNLMDLNFSREGYQDMWRLRENASRNGNLYPTHGLGPVCQVMNINRGDQMDYLTSTSSADFSMGIQAEALSREDPYFKNFSGTTFRGNMNTTVVKTRLGKTIMIQHDVSSPRPYSRIHLLSGTKGIARKWPAPQRIAVGHQWLNEEEMKLVEEQYTPEIVKRVGEMARQIGGHGGMDFIMDWRLIDCLRNGLPLDQDVYDAALWSAIAPLSEISVNNRSQSVNIPDFTNGAWKTNSPVSLSLENAGNTKVIMPQ